MMASHGGKAMVSMAVKAVIERKLPIRKDEGGNTPPPGPPGGEVFQNQGGAWRKRPRKLSEEQAL
jgi:hypothetical protein